MNCCLKLLQLLLLGIIISSCFAGPVATPGGKPDDKGNPNKEKPGECKVTDDTQDCEENSNLEPEIDDLDPRARLSGTTTEGKDDATTTLLCDTEGRVYPTREHLKLGEEELDAVEDTNCLKTLPRKEGQTLDLLLRPSSCLIFLCSREINLVCGTNGITYLNPCLLRIAACSLSFLRLRIRHFGRCRRGGRDPTALCIDCTFSDTPVCGNDGRTYTNQCFLERERCLTNNQNLAVQYNGHCQPFCNSFCGNDYSPVYGTDGQTYYNLCTLNWYACRNPWRWITFGGWGVGWRWYGGRRHWGGNHHGDRRRHSAVANDCSFTCSNKFAPACGTDGVTYWNPCELYKVACQAPHKDLTMDHIGYCFTANGDLKCQDTCIRTKDYVCGNDGVTYQNLCLLKMEACQTGNDTLAVASQGPCAPDVCSWECPGVVSPVCGPDSTNSTTRATFTNKCYMFKEACAKNVDVINLTEDACDGDGDGPREEHALKEPCIVWDRMSSSREKCVFPFRYKGVLYNACTTVDRDFPWCATQVRRRSRDMIDGHWGKCNSKFIGCPTCDCSRRCRCQRDLCPVGCPR